MTTRSPRAILPRPGLTLAVLAVTQFLLILDAAIVNVALASIGSDLDASPTALTWVVNAYVLTFGGLLLLGGRLADLVGARRVFVVGVLVFAAASLAGALAPDQGWLVGARAAQGAGAALAAPAVLALAMTGYPAGPARHRVLGVLGATAGAGGAGGLLLGGLLTQTLGWRSVLWVNVPVAAVVVLGAALALPADDAPAGSRRGFDAAGALTATAGLSALVYAVVGAPGAGWASPTTLALLLVAALLVAGFWAREARAAYPLVPPGFLRLPGVGAAVAVSALTLSAMFPMWFLLALESQDVRGYSPLRTGLAILPLVAVLVALNARTAPVVARFGTRGPVTVGLLLAAFGLAWFSRMTPDGSYLAEWVGPSLLTGTGFGLAYVATIVAATAGVPDRQAGLVSGVLNTAQQLGGAVGLAVALSLATAAADLGSAAAERAARADGYAAGLLVTAGLALLAAVVARTTLWRTTAPGPADVAHRAAPTASSGSRLER